jgi:hypothetical protein
MKPTVFPPDEFEEQIPDVQTARALLAEKDPSFLRYSHQRRASFEKAFGAGFAQLLDNAERALLIAYARFASRHGTWGEDLHAYHNEGHAVEILADRLNYLCDKAGADALQPEDWVLLTLFGVMHDLRQREAPEVEALVGANERASIQEAHRILTIAGFDPKADVGVYRTIDSMIAGSTFHVQPKQNPFMAPAEAAVSCGALAPMLIKQLELENPDWRDEPELVDRVRLTLIASDLDTANVAEPMIKFSRSAVRLCKEIEFRSQRDLGTESAKSVLFFLTVGQESYFFNLHDFDSEIGREVLGAMKEKNGPLVHQLCDHMREKFGEEPGEGVTGQMVIDEFMHKASEISGRVAKTSPARH